jgi:pimeloyl-ACP methyl ester carboxylesterase
VKNDTVGLNLEKDSGAVAEPVAARHRYSRRTALAAGTSLGASFLLGRLANAAGTGEANVNAPLNEYDIATNGITLHVTEQGTGPAVLFVHGFPDTSYTWRRQMKAVAAAGFRAIAPDMRGYGKSSAPADASLYTPLHTGGDLVGLLDYLKVASAVLVGHDWGATHAWNSALMRPDRFTAVFGLSVPYVPRGDVSVFDRMRKAGNQDKFYMFEQIAPSADQIWANAAVTIPGILYWASGSAPSETRWSPMDPNRSLHRPAPRGLPTWAEPDSTHRISRWAQLLPRCRTVFQFVRALERRESRAARLLYDRQVGRAQGAVPSYRGRDTCGHSGSRGWHRIG